MEVGGGGVPGGGRADYLGKRASLRAARVVCGLRNVLLETVSTLSMFLLWFVATVDRTCPPLPPRPR